MPLHRPLHLNAKRIEQSFLQSGANTFIFDNSFILYCIWIDVAINHHAVVIIHTRLQTHIFNRLASDAEETVLAKAKQKIQERTSYICNKTVDCFSFFPPLLLFLFELFFAFS